MYNNISRSCLLPPFTLGSFKRIGVDVEGSTTWVRGADVDDCVTGIIRADAS